MHGWMDAEIICCLECAGVCPKVLTFKTFHGLYQYLLEAVGNTLHFFFLVYFLQDQILCRKDLLLKALDMQNICFHITLVVFSSLPIL